MRAPLTKEKSEKARERVGIDRVRSDERTNPRRRDGRRRFLERKQISFRDPETPTDEAAEKNCRGNPPVKGPFSVADLHVIDPAQPMQAVFYATAAESKPSSPFGEESGLV
jgi:hypothetical protein